MQSFQRINFPLHCFSKFSNQVLPPICYFGHYRGLKLKTSCGKFLNLTHYFPYDVKLRLLAHSRSFLANQKARNAIIGAENLLNTLYVQSFQRINFPLHSFTALEFKAGKDNVTTSSPGLFGCKKIYFQTPFYGGQPVTVLASVGHTVKSQTPRNGAAVWVEGVKGSEFTICVLEFSQGSNKTLLVNWIALSATPYGSQMGTSSLNSWTTGTECKRIDFQQVRICFLKWH